MDWLTITYWIIIGAYLTVSLVMFRYGRTALMINRALDNQLDKELLTLIAPVFFLNIQIVNIALLIASIPCSYLLFGIKGVVGVLLYEFFFKGILGAIVPLFSYRFFFRKIQNHVNEKASHFYLARTDGTDEISFYIKMKGLLKNIELDYNL